MCGDEGLGADVAKLRADLAEWEAQLARQRAELLRRQGEGRPQGGSAETPEDFVAGLRKKRNALALPIASSAPSPRAPHVPCAISPLSSPRAEIRDCISAAGSSVHEPCKAATHVWSCDPVEPQLVKGTDKQAGFSSDHSNPEMASGARAPLARTITTSLFAEGPPNVSRANVDGSMACNPTDPYEAVTAVIYPRANGRCWDMALLREEMVAQGTEAASLAARRACAAPLHGMMPVAKLGEYAEKVGVSVLVFRDDAEGEAPKLWMQRSCGALSTVLVEAEGPMHCERLCVAHGRGQDVDGAAQAWSWLVEKLQLETSPGRAGFDLVGPEDVWSAGWVGMVLPGGRDQRSGERDKEENQDEEALGREAGMPDVLQRQTRAALAAAGGGGGEVCTLPLVDDKVEDEDDEGGSKVAQAFGEPFYPRLQRPVVLPVAQQGENQPARPR